MSEQEKKHQRIYDLLNAESKPKFLCLPYTKQRKIFTEKELFKENWEWKIEQKRKERFLTALATTICLKKVSELSSASEEEGWLSLARRGLVSSAHVVWSWWKSQYRKMVSLSLCRKTFKLKGNKKFRTWTKKS